MLNPANLLLSSRGSLAFQERSGLPPDLYRNRLRCGCSLLTAHLPAEALNLYRLFCIAGVQLLFLQNYILIKLTHHYRLFMSRLRTFHLRLMRPGEIERIEHQIDRGSVLEVRHAAGENLAIVLLYHLATLASAYVPMILRQPTRYCKHRRISPSECQETMHISVRRKS